MSILRYVCVLCFGFVCVAPLAQQGEREGQAQAALRDFRQRASMTTDHAALFALKDEIRNVQNKYPEASCVGKLSALSRDIDTSITTIQEHSKVVRTFLVSAAQFPVTTSQAGQALLAQCDKALLTYPKATSTADLKKFREDLAKRVTALAVAEKEQEDRERERERRAEEDYLKSPAGQLWTAHQDWSRSVCDKLVAGRVEPGMSTEQIRIVHPNWEPEVCRAISGGSLVIGMTSEQVRLSWGEPDKINATTTAAGRREQWVYERRSADEYAYVENGVLTAVQESRSR